MAREIQEYERIISTSLCEFLQLSNDVGGPVGTLGQLVLDAFKASLDFIRFGVYNQKPVDQSAQTQLDPLRFVISSIQEFRSSHREHEYFDQLSIISESISALSWIVMYPAPAQFVHDLKESGEYYGIRVLRNQKGNQLHVNWVNSWYRVLTELENYVRQFHTTGFTWGSQINVRGQALPPPPPPPPAPVCDFTASGDDDRAALLRDLNAGTDITKRLKKVNVGGPKIESKPILEAAASSKIMPAKKVYPPKFALDGKKWCVEYQRNNYDIKIKEAQMSESLAVYKCENTVIQLESKVNYVTIDSCKKTSVVLSSIISSVEIIHSDSVQIQCNGHVPLINVDGSDGVQIFVNKDSSSVEVISSKSSAINICVAKPDGDYAEMAVPEQIKTVIVNGKLQSSIIDKN